MGVFHDSYTVTPDMFEFFLVSECAEYGMSIDAHHILTYPDVN